jgi:MFS family permease
VSLPQEAPAAPSPDATPVAPPGGRAFGALRHRNFAILWLSLITSNVGTWMQQVGQGWLVLQLADRPLYLGLVALAFAIPMILLPPFGGAISDRVDKLGLLRVTELLQALNALVLALLTLSGAVTVWHVLATAFVGAVLLAVSNPNRQALLPSLVSREDFMSAISLNSAVFTGAALVGPLLAGQLLGPIGPGGLFMLNALSYGAVLLATMLMRGVDAAPRASGASGLWADVTEGLRYVLGARLLLVLLAVSALSGLLGRSYSALLPVFARDVWEVGEQGYGWLLTAPGLGALIGAFGLAAVGEVRRKGVLLLVSMLGFALLLLAFSYAPVFWPAVLLLLIAGILNALFGTSIATLIQTNAPGALRGRAMSVYTITVIGIPSLGAMGTASVAELLGPRNAVGLAAGCLAVLAAGLLLRGRTVREAG